MNTNLDMSVEDISKLRETAKQAMKAAEQAENVRKQAEQNYNRAKESADKLTRFIGLWEERQKAIQQIHALDQQIEEFRKDTTIPVKPKLVLPKLLPDLSDVDPACRDHLDPQAEQIIDILKKLTTPDQPFVHSSKVKEYIEHNFEIEFPEYWRDRTSPREPERWWKNIYDKCVERLDLVLHKVARKSQTGKKGVYALAEYYNTYKATHGIAPEPAMSAGEEPEEVFARLSKAKPPVPAPKTSEQDDQPGLFDYLGLDGLEDEDNLNLVIGPGAEFGPEQYGSPDDIYHLDQDGKYKNGDGKLAPNWMQVDANVAVEH